MVYKLSFFLSVDAPFVSVLFSGEVATEKKKTGIFSIGTVLKKNITRSTKFVISFEKGAF